MPNKQVNDEMGWRKGETKTEFSLCLVVVMIASICHIALMVVAVRIYSHLDRYTTADRNLKMIHL